MTTPVRVVVVTWSPGESLTSFLSSLSSASSCSVEVVLADNGSTDGAPERAVGPGVSLLRTGGNLGYGAAANRGAEGHRGEFLVVANPDVIWQPGSLDLLLEAAVRWPSGGCFGPAIITPDGLLYPSARAFPSLARGIGHALVGWWWPGNPWTKSYRDEAGPPRETATGWLSGACMLLRREAFDAVGGFDPSYFMYCEDMDLCRRLAEKGWASIYVPTSVVVHAGGHATRREPRAMLRAHHQSLYRYLARQYAGPRYAVLRTVLGIGLALRYLMAIWVRTIGEGAAPTRTVAVLGVSRKGAGPRQS